MDKSYECATDPGDRARLTTGYIELAGLWVREGCNQCLVNLDRETARKLATDLHEWAGPVVRYPEPEPELYVLPPHPVWIATYREVLRACLRDGYFTSPAIETARRAADESIK